MIILDLEKKFVKALDAYDESFIEHELNKVPKLNIKIPQSLGKYFKEEYYIQLEGHGEYLVKEKKSSHSYYDVVCKPNLDVFFKDYYPNYTYTTTTLKSVLDRLMNPLGWTFECDDLRKETLSGKEKNTLEIILHGLDLFEYEYIWDIPNKKLIAGPNIGNDKGSYIHQDINLREMNITTHSYNLVTRLIPKGKDDLGIEFVNNGVPYLEPTNKYTNKIIYGTWTDQRYTIAENLKKAGQKLVDSIGTVYKTYEVDIINLARLNKKYNYLDYGIGDTLTLVDSINNVRSKERVIAKKEYIREKLKDTLVLSNIPLSINKINDLEKSNLQAQIEVNRQYITVLEGEIKSKVSKEVYDGIEKRVSAAEEKITDAAITQKVQSTVTNELSKSETAAKFNNIISSEIAPQDKTKLWRDENVGILKYYDTSVNEWLTFDQNALKNIDELSSNLDTSISRTKEEILNNVSETYATKEAVDSVLIESETKIIQTSENINIQIEEVIKSINENKELTDEELSTIKTYFNFRSDGLEIGRSTDEYTTLFANNRWSILSNGEEIAYFSDNTMSVFSGNFINDLKIGGYAFIPRENGNLSFTWVGK